MTIYRPGDEVPKWAQNIAEECMRPEETTEKKCDGFLENCGAVTHQQYIDGDCAECQGYEMRPEETIEKKCVEIALDAGWLNFKLDKFGSGWPDQLFMGPSRAAFCVEFKVPGETPTRQQLERHSELMQLGFAVYVCTSVEEFEKIFDDERWL